MFRTLSLPLLLLFCSFSATARAEVIYDNTQTVLGAGPIEEEEYGDQLDLQGTARTLTSLTFYYYADIVPDGQTLKVRLYTNETPYDDYRNSPTKLLYESGYIPMSTGYNAGTIDNLSV